MLKINQYSAKGIKTSDFSLPKEMEVKENLNLLAQSVRVSESKTHPGLSKVKTRSEINRTTKKWYKQKGTGRARHGARSAPIFVGGGVSHGPTGIKRNLNLSKNMAKKSLFIAITLKVKKERVLVVSSISTLKKT
ncbi:MAG: 50S ribosomal protein L4, partial [Patescibacteria group bacterium]